MPNKRSTRRKRQNKDHLIKGVRTPSDIEKLLAEMNRHNLYPPLKKFIVYTCERQVYGPDKSDEFIIYCLSSYFILGMECYHKLPPRTNFIPIDVIREGANRDFKINAGLKDNLVQLIKIKTENLSAQNKTIILSMDEVSLSPGLKYDENLDLVIGYEDDGKVRTTAQARFALNIWISCLSGTWMMPLAFIFTENSASPEKIKEFLFESLTKLDDIGLEVVCIVTKMRANFYELSRQLNISPTNQTFKVGTKEIIFLFDAPQLMNITRNILMKYNLKFDGFETSWMFLKKFFINDCQRDSRKTKLTLHHLKPTKLDRAFPQSAIQLMSNTVATEMLAQISNKKLPEEARGTAMFLDLIDKLFDIMNSTQETSMNQFNSSYKGTKHQVKFLVEMTQFLENLKVFHKDKDCTAEIKFAKGWLISIRGMMKVWDILKARKFDYLLTRNANCEMMDRFMNVLILPLFDNEPCTSVEFFDWHKRFFISSYFAPDNMIIIGFERFLSKIFKRIPPTVHHNVGDEDFTSAQPCECQNFGFLYDMATNLFQHIIINDL